MILHIPINCQWRATYILKTELSPACYDKETDAGQSDILLFLKTAATTVICIMLTMPRCSFLLKSAKFGQEHIDAASLEADSYTLAKPACPPIPRNSLIQTIY